MFYVSTIKTGAPSKFSSPLQAKVYAALALLRIPFERVETDEAITMEDCVAINAALKMKMVKTLFLCNHQHTEFYLFVTCGDKPFRAKDFSKALHVSRVSFAPAALMLDMLGTPVGAATIFSALLDVDHKVHIVLDQDVICEPWYGCSDGLTTSYLKIQTSAIVHTFLNYTGHAPQIIEV
jgi:Ala-tRNA(Pro) deacylase